MPRIQLDLIWTVSALFCGYSLYTSFVSFMWKEKGCRVFQNLRIPVVVFVYFLVPCVALFLLNMAYEGVHQLAWTFVLATCFILSISFVVMLYILTVPNWPVGKFLQIDKVPITLVRVLISVNAGGSLLIAIMSAVIVVQTPHAIQLQGQGVKVNLLTAHSQQLELEKAKSTDSISSIRLAAIRKVIDENVKTASGILGLISSLAGIAVSVRALGERKKAPRKTAAGR